MRQVAHSSRYPEAVPRSSRLYRDERVLRWNLGQMGRAPFFPGDVAGGPLIPLSEAVPRSSRPYRDERVLVDGKVLRAEFTIRSTHGSRWFPGRCTQVAHSSRYRKLCPVHRGLIAMSGSFGWNLGTDGRTPFFPGDAAGGPLILISGAVPRSSRLYRDERVLRWNLGQMGRTPFFPNDAPPDFSLPTAESALPENCRSGSCWVSARAFS